MSNLNEQLFQELDDEIAANLSGGTAKLYENGDGSGRSLSFKTGTKNFKDYDFKTLYIYISPGETWNFYTGVNYKGHKTTLKDGGHQYNDEIGSLKLVS
jgi:hypothetical protein